MVKCTIKLPSKELKGKCNQQGCAQSSQTRTRNSKQRERACRLNLKIKLNRQKRPRGGEIPVSGTLSQSLILFTGVTLPVRLGTSKQRPVKKKTKRLKKVGNSQKSPV